MNPDWPATRSGHNEHMVRRDRYGEPIEVVELELERIAAREAIRRAREALPPREAPLRAIERREGLKGRMEARTKRRRS